MIHEKLRINCLNIFLRTYWLSAEACWCTHIIHHFLFVVFREFNDNSRFALWSSFKLSGAFHSHNWVSRWRLKIKGRLMTLAIELHREFQLWHCTLSDENISLIVVTFTTASFWLSFSRASIWWISFYSKDSDKLTEAMHEEIWNFASSHCFVPLSISML